MFDKLFHHHRYRKHCRQLCIGVLIALVLLFMSLEMGLWIDDSYVQRGALATRNRAFAAENTVFSWTTHANSPIPRTESHAVTYNKKVYIFGGFINGSFQATARSDIYDPATDSWTRIADTPQVLTHAGTVLVEDTVWLMGGFVGNHPGLSTKNVWLYDISEDSWTAGPALPEPNSGAGAVVLGRRIHVIGGTNRVAAETHLDSANHYVYDLDNPAAGWQERAALPLARNHVGAAVLNGEIYIIGGQFQEEEADTNQARVDVYNPATDSWRQVTDLPTPRGHFTSSTLVVDGRILIVGGSINGGSHGRATDEMLMYDPVSKVWLFLPKLPNLNYRKTPVATLIDGRLYVINGGTDGAPTSTVFSAQLPGTWETGKNMTQAMGEVTAGIIGNKLYVVGERSLQATLAYDLGLGTWTANNTLAKRPDYGNHHAGEVINNKWYLFGGLTRGQGKVQIYDPATNTWSRGADMPYAGGSIASALIDGKVYVAGGIVGSATMNTAAVYDPANDSWSVLPAMPVGVNHAAATTDGEKFYIFGGRSGGNTVSNGFDYVQIYDPATNSWQSSSEAGSTLAPLPQARGGMGKAVYVAGEFYIIGGETSTGAGATANKVYDRVDIYNPRTNNWRLGPAMTTARHGIFPVTIGKRIYVAGGGTQAGASESTILEIYNLEDGLSDPSPTPTNTASPTATATATSTPCCPATSTSDATNTATSTASASPIATNTASPTLTATATSTASAAPSATSTASTSPIAGSSPTSSSTATLSPTVSSTPTSSSTATLSPTASSTATNTKTPTSPGQTNAPTNTSIPTTTTSTAEPCCPVSPTPSATSSADPVPSDDNTIYLPLIILAQGTAETP
jgi:N-acetylneuraminic acid mutarotase